MSGAIKGITIEFRGDATPLQKAIRTVDSELKKTDSELKKVNNALKFNPSSVDLWKQKQQLLKDKISETNDKLKSLKDAQKQMDAARVDKNSEEYRKLQREIIETESKLKTFKSQLNTIGNVKLHALGEQFKQIGSKMTAAGKTLTTKVTAPLAALGGVALKVGADFDTAMSQVAATMGVTVDDIQDLRDFAIQMGSTTAFSATQAAEGLNYMALAGYSADEAMEMLPTVLNLAAAGNIELASASDMVTDAQSALGLSTEETVTLIDQMAAASSTTNTSVEQLGSAILTIGGTAKMMNGGTAELAQTLGILADNGIKGSEGGTALRNILLSLSAPTEKAAGFLDELGVSAFDAEGNMRPMQDTMGDLKKALDNLSSEEEKTYFLANIFNKRDLKSVNALLGTDAERWEEVAGAIGNAGGAAEQMAETQLDNMQGSLTLLKSALEGAGIAVSDVLAPAVRKIAELLTRLVDKFNNLSPKAQKIIVVVGGIVAAIGPLLVIIGVLASAIGSIISVIGVVGPAIAGLMSGALLPIVGAIAAVIAIGVLLYKNWDKIKAKALELKTKVVTTFNNLKKNVATTWNNIKTAVTTAVTNMASAVRTKIDSLKSSVASKFQAIKTAITDPISKAKETIRGIIDKIKGLFPLNVGKIFSNIKLPKIQITKGEAPWGIGGKGTAPTISLDWVNWYAKGGIFNSPAIIGVGDNRAGEAVVPLDKFWDKMDQMQAGSNIVININGANKDPREIAEEVKRMLIKETNQRRLAWQ